MNHTATKPGQLPADRLPGMDAPLVKKRLTKAEAYERDGPAPAGQVWDEESQDYIPLAAAVLASRLEQPLDLEKNLQMFQRARETLKRFVSRYLEEAEYDAKGGLVAGKVRDYYSFPGSPKDGPKALTKRGAEKLSQLFRFAKGSTRTVASTETKEYASATVEVVLVDNYRREVGSGVGSCTTAESGFQQIGAGKKYGGWWDNDTKAWKRAPDFRAALNDIMARAAKRAYVQAVIVATGADEFFTVAKDDEPRPAPSSNPDDANPADRPERFRFPSAIKTAEFQHFAGKSIDDKTITVEHLTRLAQWCRTATTSDPQGLERILAAVEEELECRRFEGGGAL